MSTEVKLFLLKTFGIQIELIVSIDSGPTVPTSRSLVTQQTAGLTPKLPPHLRYTLIFIFCNLQYLTDE